MLTTGRDRVSNDIAFAGDRGEQIAIGILKDQKSCYNENFGGFSLTKFDGTTVTV